MSKDTGKHRLLRGAVNHMGRQIYAYLLAHTTKEFSYRDLQNHFQVPAGQAFNSYVARARLFAKQEGNCIAFCYAGDDEELVLTCNPNDAQLMRSLAYRGKAIYGQTVNYVDQLEWGAKNATDPQVRRQCRLVAKALAGANQTQEALRELAEDMLDGMG